MSRRFAIICASVAFPALFLGCPAPDAVVTGSGGSGSGTGGTSSGGSGQPDAGSAATGGDMGTPGTGGVVGTGGAIATGGAAAPGGASAGTGGASPGGAGGPGGRVGTAGAGGGALGGGGAGGAAASGGAAGQAACQGANATAGVTPVPLTLSGNLNAHDPAAIVVGNTIHLAATGLLAKSSTNLMAWQAGSNPLNPRPAWVAQQVPGASNLWAPDLSFFGGAYHMYYAASTFGSNKSCIGHSTRAALDSGAWADQGTVICSNMDTSDNWNAIDPNVVIDDEGTPWMSLGSFWGGLKMIKLTPAGARADTMVYSIAARPSAGGALEAPWVFKRCGTYYLFVSWGACCDGAYDYNIRVGRSTTVTGPYVDKAGVQMMQGGGTLLVTGNATWTAPGHNSVIVYGNKTYNIYHALTAQNRSATLRVSELVWDADGWPISGGP